MRVREARLTHLSLKLFRQSQNGSQRQPPPPLRDAPPAFGEFAASYRKRPGKGYATPYSEIRSAYWDAYGMTPEHAAELRSEQYA